ncbi:hypothetical protein QUA81_20190 [Microcoleus sp. F6_B4]
MSAPPRSLHLIGLYLSLRSEASSLVPTTVWSIAVPSVQGDEVV